MPEYLTPGVYLEETSFRSRSIEGVATATFGMAGLTRYGPVPHILPLATGDVVMVPTPVLVTSYTEYERAFGGLEQVAGDTNYLGYAARAFFGNGGRRLYVSRVYPWTQTNGVDDLTKGFAALPVGAGGAAWRARWPGAAGNQIAVRVTFSRSKNLLVGGGLRGVGPGAAVEVIADRTKLPRDYDPATKKPDPLGTIRIVVLDDTGQLALRKANGAGTDPIVDDGTSGMLHVSLNVMVRWGADRSDVYPGLEVDSASPRSIVSVLQAVDPTDEFGLIWLDPGPNPATLLTDLIALSTPTYLTGGTDGDPVSAAAIAGQPADPDDEKRAATGLAALAEIDDIAIVASPDAVRFDEAGQLTAVQDLIAHCEALKAYRIGIVDPPKDSSISQVRRFRSQFDTTYAALYYPWMDIVDPTAKNDPSAAPATLQLPPCGFTAGVYARSDVARGVHKAPANEVVLGMTRFRQNVTYDRQSVLNPEGINALRFFEGRANRVWGARTMSSDPEWRYVNVRRLFIFLEHSIDKSTQWAVFEPNNERLWASIRQSIEDFLLVVWRTGALMGTKPEEAFFIRCDRSTMSQNDLDNGRLICEIGVAPTYPAEFVIFRIGQWTADATQS